MSEKNEVNDERRERLKGSILRALVDELPPVLFRNNRRFRDLTGLSARTMANLDSLGKGPATRVKVGRVIGYPRDAMLDFLTKRSRVL